MAVVVVYSAAAVVPVALADDWFVAYPFSAFLSLLVLPLCSRGSPDSLQRDFRRSWRNMHLFLDSPLYDDLRRSADIFVAQHGTGEKCAQNLGTGSTGLFPVQVGS